MGTTWGNIIWAGFAASVLAACVFWLVRTLGWTRVAFTSFLGCFVGEDPRVPLTETVGLVLFLASGTTVLAIVYAWAMQFFGGAGWGTGALVGLLHGALMVAALPWLARINRGIRAGRVPPPGRAGLEWGRWAPAGLVAGHLVYGAVLGGILGAA